MDEFFSKLCTTIFFKTYFLSKLLPLLILPLGFILFYLLINFRKPAKRKILAVVLFLWFFSIGFVADLLWKIVEYPWQRIAESSASTADAIVVLSSGGLHTAPGKENIIEWKDPDRFFAGITLFKMRKAPQLFFTGGATPYEKTSKDEGTLYKEYAIRLGLPSAAIKTTGRVINTAQEAIEIKRMLNKNKSPSTIILVTSAFHMQRAKKQFERQGLFVYPFPVDFKSSHLSPWQSPYQWIPNANSLSRSSNALREMIGRIIYRSW